VVIGMAALLTIIGMLVGTSLESFYKDLPYYQTRFQKDISSFQAYLASKGLPVTETFLLEELIPEAVESQTARVITTLGSVLFEIVLILFIVTFILLEASSFPGKLRAILGNPVNDFHLFMKFVYDINRYMLIKTAMSLTVGLFISLWLTLLGVDFPILWGVLAFLLHFVPNVGALIASIPAVLLALLQLGVGRAALAASGYLAVNFVLGNVVEPLLMGRRLGLSTLVVFLSLIFWGSLLGFVGVVLCIPLTMSLKFACENSKSAQWVAVLLGPGMSPAQFSSTQKEEAGTS
jgi:AI-2 transport protein TqsA